MIPPTATDGQVNIRFSQYAMMEEEDLHVVLDTAAIVASAMGKKSVVKPPTPEPKPEPAPKIPRPPNSFILYRQYHHPLVKEANPGIHNNEICK
jgi:hypothetical protein